VRRVFFNCNKHGFSDISWNSRGEIECCPAVKSEKNRSIIIDVLNIQWKYANKETDKTCFIRKITESQIRDLFYVRDTVFQEVLVYIFFCFRFTELNERCFIDRV
jgi:hypothetical protein